MADLATLKRKRCIVKGSLTAFHKYLDKTLSRQDLTELEISILHDKLANTSDLLGEFNIVQNEIEMTCDLAALIEQTQEREAFEDNFYELTNKAKLFLKQFDEQKQKIQISKCESVGIKLPDILLPKFNGNFEDWLEFRDIFDSLIHKNDSLAPMQKFFYLRGALEGTAAASIKKIQYTANNYAVAWDALCERFNNTKKLLHDHLGALLLFEPIQKGSSDKLQQVADNITRHLGAIEQLGQSVDNWDCLSIFWISQKIDNSSLCDWERQQRNKTDPPNIDEFLGFLRERANFVDSLDYKCNQTRDKSSKFNKEPIRGVKKEFSRVLVSNEVSNHSYTCSFCHEDHSIYTCESFLNLSIPDRNEFVKNNPSMCTNCLRKGHPIHKCRMGPCRKRRSRHNTLLHGEIKQAHSDATKPESSANVLSSGVLQCSTGQTILSTARVLLSDNNGEFHSIRVLLDCGSQTSFITERLQMGLKITSYPSNLSIYGITNNISSVKRKCEVLIKSQYGQFTADLTCYILSEITGNIPSVSVESVHLKIPSHVILADPDFHMPGPIDMLIGADLFWLLLETNKIALGKYGPHLQETKLGWIVSGPLGALSPKIASCNLSLNQELLEALTKFWEVEETLNNKLLSPDELFCEQIFADTTSRNPDGRFIVDMPLKQNPEVLGESRSQAERRFLAMERRLARNDTLRNMYRAFMQEYMDLNHMSRIDSTSQPEYYMPHHGVLKESSLTTKLRVVFDASASTSNGISLNNIQAIGPVIQDDLLSIILRFRQYTYVISADIAKMYRQVLINPTQRSLQRVLWRDNPSEPICTYQLNTVTYGQAAASFLSIRCLFQLATEVQENKPVIARIIKHDFYVDDLLTGADSLQDAQQICREVSDVLKGGCFELRKWCSNSPDVLRDISHSHLAYDTLELSRDDKTKTLGLTWACQNDRLLYNINITLGSQNNTKREVLSIIARIFDPLGLLGPCIILAKILLQELWSAKVSWDDPIPDDMKQTWDDFQNELPMLNNLLIPRHVMIQDYVRVQLHGFCDSSERAYGACIYMRSTDKDNNTTVMLLCAESKVAPIKVVTIPRLELCGAVVLSRLTKKVVDSMKLQFEQCFLWSDSTIVLNWVKTTPNLLKTFTGNRVSEIQSLTQNCHWRHVPSKENPADVVSRGLAPSQILDSELWWNGPHWLTSEQAKWPNEQYQMNDLPDLKSQTCLACKSEDILEFPFEKFSSFRKMINVMAYMLRFKENCFLSKNNRVLGNLTPLEFNRALRTLIKICQNQCFGSDIQELEEGTALKPKNKLSGLTPFLDSDHIMRVGGRLKYSDYDFDKRHPILLHGKHHFTKMLFKYEHDRLLHAGPQLLLSTTRNTYWPISGRNLARNVVQKCVRCFRFNAKTIQPRMGDLPNARVMPSSPFSVTGVDYAGPFQIKDKKGRGCKITKCYLGLFICFSTKAVRLELISSLSSEAFLQAFRRFISRRGKPTKMYSDNGTNFVGVQKDLGNFLKSKQNVSSITDFSSLESIEWNFIPPYSPHFGGLWEAGVKSSKHHLKRVLSKTPLTFEELTTLLCQVEAILNSRPLSPLSSNPNDLSPLTPSHFIIGKPLVAAPDKDVTDVKMNRLDRFQLVQQMTQHFWQRWKTEYISELQLRSSWQESQGKLTENALVLIKDDNTQPTRWQLGRVLNLHPGPDGICRVASIKTSSGIIKRGFQKICPLPSDL